MGPLLAFGGQKLIRGAPNASHEAQSVASGPRRNLKLVNYRLNMFNAS